MKASSGQFLKRGECVIDYFHLLKVGDQWLIVSKLWDGESENN